MKPVIVLVGRPNVGKSTFFNRITRASNALVADEPGLTRDRQYGSGRIDDHEFIVVDTGGIMENIGETTSAIAGGKAVRDITDLVSIHTLHALNEADVVLFLVDGRQGISATDRDIAALLRKTGITVWLVVNKTEGMVKEAVISDFFSLGLGQPYPISAAHGDGTNQLLEEIFRDFRWSEIKEPEEAGNIPRIAVVGRPNVGKSTLVNALLGEERVIVFDQPGTTRDSIRIPFEHGKDKYILIDTAGIRRKKNVKETVEKFSVIKTLQAIDEANVVILVLDASQGVTDQDASLAGYILERGRAVVVVANKWDKPGSSEKDRMRDEIDRKLSFLAFAQKHFISALKGTGVRKIYGSIDEAFRAATINLPTAKLNQLLRQAVEKTTPPLVRGRRIRLKYAHQGGKNPPTIIVHGNQLNAVPTHYRRYLVNFFRKAFALSGTPLRVEFKRGKNPFK